MSEPSRYHLCLQHWHPLLPSHILRRRPLCCQLAGQRVVLFRTASGMVGAVDEVCLHRRMSLADGEVQGEQLVCPYHRWRYSADGTVHCPLTNGEGLRQPAFQAMEAHGLIWLRQSQPGESDPPRLPSWPYADLVPAGITMHQVPVPLELTLDNFTETEHTTSIHQVFGFSNPSEIQLKVAFEPEVTRVWNRGPQKPFPRLFDAFIDIRPSDSFANDWVTHFQPLFTVYDQAWWRQQTQRRFRLRVVMFFLPLNNTLTQLTTLLYSSRVLPGLLHPWLVAPIIRAITSYELSLDVKALSSLADLNPELSAGSLGPFDRVLLENRRRIQALYLKR